MSMSTDAHEPIFVPRSDFSYAVPTGKVVFVDRIRDGRWVVPYGVRFIAVQGAPESQPRSDATFEHNAREQAKVYCGSYRHGHIAGTPYRVGWHPRAQTSQWCVLDLHNLGAMGATAYPPLHYFIPKTEVKAPYITGKDVYLDRRRHGYWVVNPDVRFIAVEGSSKDEPRLVLDTETEESARRWAYTWNQRGGEPKSTLNWDLQPVGSTIEWCVIDLWNLDIDRYQVAEPPCVPKKAARAVTDEELVADFAQQQRNERPHSAVTIRGRTFSIAEIRAAWSRELRRKIKEAEEKRKLPCRGDWLEDHE